MVDGRQQVSSRSPLIKYLELQSTEPKELAERRSGDFHFLIHKPQTAKSFSAKHQQPPRIFCIISMISLVCPNLEKLGRCRMSSNQQLYHNDAKETKQLPQAIQSSSSPPTSSSPSSKTLVAATAAAKNSFPFKLYRCLEDAAIDESKAEIISWLPDGKGFKVHKPNEFVDQLLVRYFKTQTKLKSFTRQVRLFHPEERGNTSSYKMSSKLSKSRALYLTNT